MLTSLKSIAAAGLAALALATAPAQARDGYYRGHDGGGDDAAIAIGAGVVDRDHYYYDDGYYYPRDRYYYRSYPRYYGGHDYRYYRHYRRGWDGWRGDRHRGWGYRDGWHRGYRDRHWRY
jgi:hypothetical protein